MFYKYKFYLKILIKNHLILIHQVQMLTFHKLQHFILNIFQEIIEHYLLII